MKNNQMTKVFFSFTFFGLFFLLGGYYTFVQIDGIGKEWEAYLSTVANRSTLESEVKGNFGYGGAIHHFKNYILRSDDKYYQKFLQSYDKTMHSLDRYSHLADSYQHIDKGIKREKQNVQILRDTFQEYRDILETAKSLKSKGENISSIERRIRIDDTKAMKAFTELAEHTTELTDIQTQILSTSIQQLKFALSLIAILLFFCLFFLAFYIINNTLKPVVRMTKALNHLGQNDLTFHLSPNDVQRKDEVGVMAIAYENTLKMLFSGIRHINDNIANISSHSFSITSFSEDIKIYSGQLTNKANLVSETGNDNKEIIQTLAAAIEEASASVTSISSSIEELSANISSVAAAAEEASANMSGMTGNFEQIAKEINSVAKETDKMSLSLSDVANSTSEAMQISNHANESAQNSLKAMNTLNEISNKIGRVVKLISTIAGQTNMLSLNATIEAASAGEAGKGFAVVANEVKDLAHQTANANDEIATLIEHVQKHVVQALENTQEVTTVIGKVLEINRSISQTIERQSRSSEEIKKAINSLATASKESSLNIREASLGIKEITRSAAEASVVAKESSRSVNEAAIGIKEGSRSSMEVTIKFGEMDKNIQLLHNMINEITERISVFSQTSKDLSHLLKELEQYVNQYKLLPDEQSPLE